MMTEETKLDQLESGVAPQEHTSLEGEVYGAVQDQEQASKERASGIGFHALQAIKGHLGGGGSEPVPELVSSDSVPRFRNPGGVAPTQEDAEFQAELKAIQEREDDSHDTRKIDITFKDLRFSIQARDEENPKVKSEKVIIHPISGHIPAGKLVALMGPSGCGKSTLTDMLSAKKTANYTGGVYVNGNERGKLFTRLVSYVPQADYGNGLETVWESVKFVSEMKAEYGSKQFLKDSGLTKDDIEAERTRHIEKLLAVLALSPIKNQMIGNALVRGISGGQKRRVTLAKGLVQGPSVIFADEPTSGLSATDSELVMRALRNVCDYLDVTCICVIHQPRLSVYEMFDHLIMLTQGHCVYNGEVSKAQEYFEKLGYPVPTYVSPPDHFLDVITPGAPNSNPELFIDEYKKNIEPEINVMVDKALANPGMSEASILDHAWVRRGNKVFRLPWYRQVHKVTTRGLQLMMRDINTLSVVLGSNLFMGVMIGLVYLNVRHNNEKITYQIAFLFTLIITAALNAMTNIPLLVEDRVIFLNERAEGLYATAPYMISRTIQSTLVALVGNFILVLVGHFMAGFSASTFGYMFLLAFVTYSAIDALCAVFVCISSGGQMAQSLATLVITILTLFNGYTANLASSPAYISWINYLSPFFYGFWGGVNALFENHDFKGALPPFNTYDNVLAVYGLKPGFKWQIIGIQLAFFIFFRALQFLALKFVSNLKK
uniref:ABC transporter domain-containing protein n=1 Tax=Mucochytrium quahogii TaxID=96639 RepID=A0A7S2W9N2_9STRA|mmetsp:Transcript_9054/g.16984  ORF Transcript_9054/g.16984 Transcript_9054/m.16984 type:complete len:717 (+) Transcript_9054:46-2196(+)|eukprot:CAMPEP_0203749632 /NCGR_PEP_ID=MMETSP0098-20131031/4114_1 /ASSEMBLY_ACC=CAM_ASM_000208 /TAXON_ID=96639 /ORGANISM=" , Strain NY0313808BC1" /LENGTH=716 /DNA_ID=CAMNT_0050638717 /DNA_START=52 /DNA_END=2202 /DNA_ORIENTATION=+